MRKHGEFAPGDCAKLTRFEGGQTWVMKKSATPGALVARSKGGKRMGRALNHIFAITARRGRTVKAALTNAVVLSHCFLGG